MRNIYANIFSFVQSPRKTDLTKSSVHRLYHRIVNRNQHPESPEGETEAGPNWLRLLVLATIFIFALQGGIGCERLSQFFHLLRLHRHIGVSPTALRSLRAQMESVIIDYQQSAHSTIGKISSQVEACVAADETFFDQVILVMLDLPSGYIFVYFQLFIGNNKFSVPKILTLERIIKQLTSKLEPFSNNIQLQSA